MGSSGSPSPTIAEPFDLQHWLESSGALQRGHFLLSSGLHSPAYVQCALLLESPSRARRLGAELAGRLESYRPESVLSPALGGLIIGHEVAAALEVPFRFTEREQGSMVLRRGFRLRQGERVVVVEDVLTTGKSALEAAQVARRNGAEVCALGALLDRSSEHRPSGPAIVSLMQLDLPTYVAGECPLCRVGEALSKPGSRSVS